MRCYICNFNQEETPGTDNKVFPDILTGKEICQECHDSGVNALREFDNDEEEKQVPKD